jgi:hypothetical protein
MGEAKPPYRDWLTKFHYQVVEDAENGIANAAGIVAGFISESLTGASKADWLGIMGGLLTVNGQPVSYSEKYGAKLSTFANQWQQTDVHSLYARFWIEKNLTGKSNASLLNIIKTFTQSSGWIFNPAVSETKLQTRMKAELFMQLAMALEMAIDMGDVVEHYTPSLGAIASLGNTHYVSAEYFRLRALQLLGHPEQMVSGIPDVLVECRADPGFTDFNVAGKRDDYMGTMKRSSRDLAPFSPICTLYGYRLAEFTKDDRLNGWSKQLSEHLQSRPLDIEPFRMRDLLPPFGESCTSYEVIAEGILSQLVTTSRKATGAPV